MTQGGQISPYGMNGDESKREYRQQERLTRIHRLQSTRGMTFRAAATVVDAAMFGDGCVEGTVRAKIEGAEILYSACRYLKKEHGRNESEDARRLLTAVARGKL